MMSIKRSIRKKLFTNEPAQLKYLALLMVSMLVPAVLVGGCLYFLIFNVMADQIGIPEYIAYNLTPVINKINVVLLFGFPVLALLVFVWGAILSHRFFGPLERLSKEIDDMADKGDYSNKLMIRKHDELKPLVSSINRLVSRVRGGK